MHLSDSAKLRLMREARQNPRRRCPARPPPVKPRKRRKISSDRNKKHVLRVGQIAKPVWWPSVHAARSPDEKLELLFSRVTKLGDAVHDLRRKQRDSRLFEQTRLAADFVNISDTELWSTTPGSNFPFAMKNWVNGRFPNRNGTKLMSIDVSLDGRIANALRSGERSVILDLCGGPGGFSMMLGYAMPATTPIKVFATTKETRARNVSLRALVKDWERTRRAEFPCPLDHVEVHHEGADILRSKERQRLIEKVGPDTVSLVLADGASDWDPKSDSQEGSHLRLMIAEILVALSLLRQGGSALVKCYHALENTTRLVILAVQVVCFDRVALFKPTGSRPANGELYLFFEHRNAADPSSLLRWLAKLVDSPKLLRQQLGPAVNALSKTLRNMQSVFHDFHNTQLQVQLFQLEFMQRCLVERKLRRLSVAPHLPRLHALLQPTGHVLGPAPRFLTPEMSATLEGYTPQRWLSNILKSWAFNKPLPATCISQMQSTKKLWEIIEKHLTAPETKEVFPERVFSLPGVAHKLCAFFPAKTAVRESIAKRDARRRRMPARRAPLHAALATPTPETLDMSVLEDIFAIIEQKPKLGYSSNPDPQPQDRSGLETMVQQHSRPAADGQEETKDVYSPSSPHYSPTPSEEGELALGHALESADPSQVSTESFSEWLSVVDNPPASVPENSDSLADGPDKLKERPFSADIAGTEGRCTLSAAVEDTAAAALRLRTPVDARPLSAAVADSGRVCPIPTPGLAVFGEGLRGSDSPRAPHPGAAAEPFGRSPTGATNSTPRRAESRVAPRPQLQPSPDPGHSPMQRKRAALSPTNFPVVLGDVPYSPTHPGLDPPETLIELKPGQPVTFCMGEIKQVLSWEEWTRGVADLERACADTVRGLEHALMRVTQQNPTLLLEFLGKFEGIVTQEFEGVVPNTIYSGEEALVRAWPKLPSWTRITPSLSKNFVLTLPKYSL